MRPSFLPLDQMHHLLLLVFVLLFQPIVGSVIFTSPAATRPTSQEGPCGGNVIPLDPKLEFQNGMIYSFNYTITGAQNVPDGATHGLRLQLLKLDTEGVALELFNLQTSPTRPENGPGSFLLALPEEVDGKPFECLYDQGERCVFRLHETAGDTDYYSCLDVLTWSDKHNVTSTFVIRPSGGVPVAPATFLARLFNQYGVTGSQLALGLDEGNTMLLTDPFQMDQDGTYTVEMVTRDFLYVVNNQFMGYFPAADMADALQNNVTLATLSAIAPNFISKEFTSLSSILTTLAPINGDEEDDNSRVPPAALKASVFLAFGVVGVVAAYSGYKKMVLKQGLLPSAQDSAS